MPPVIIDLLTTLSYPHSFLDNPNLFSGGLDQIESNGQQFINVLSAKWNPQLPSIQRLVWDHSNTEVVAVVVGELN